VKALRVTIDILVILFTVFLILVSIYTRYVSEQYSVLVNISLQLMHIFFVVGIVVNIIVQINLRKYKSLVFTLLPFFFFVIAFIALAFDYRFPLFALYLFDFYVIILFYKLIRNELYDSQK